MISKSPVRIKPDMSPTRSHESRFAKFPKQHTYFPYKTKSLKKELTHEKKSKTSERHSQSMNKCLMLRKCFVPWNDSYGVEVNLICFLHSSCCAGGTNKDTVDVNDND